MAFIDQRLPVGISLGSSGGVQFQTDIVVFGNGKEYVNSRWDVQRNRYDLRYVVRNRAEGIAVYEFFLNMRGRFNTFRVKDYLECSSAGNGVSLPTNTDQEIGIGNGLTNQFQLRKNYTLGTSTYSRAITKPRLGTVLVAVNGINTTNFTTDPNTGIITLGTVPANQAIVTAGFEYDIHARFDQDSIDNIQYELFRKEQNNDLISFPSLSIIEVL